MKCSQRHAILTRPNQASLVSSSSTTTASYLTSSYILGTAADSSRIAIKAHWLIRCNALTTFTRYPNYDIKVKTSLRRRRSPPTPNPTAIARLIMNNMHACDK